MLESLGKEQHGRAPDREYFSGEGRRHIGRNDRQADHPVTEYPFGEGCEKAGGIVRRIVVGFRLGDRNELGTHRVDLGISCGGQSYYEQSRIQETSQEITQEDPTPVCQNMAKTGILLTIDRCAGEKREASRDNLRAEQNG